MDGPSGQPGFNKNLFQEGGVLVLLGWTTLTFTVKLRYQSAIWTVSLGVYPFWSYLPYFWLVRGRSTVNKERVYKKRVSLVVVFSNIKVFLWPNGVIISLRQRSVTECAEEALLLRTGLQEACSLFLRSFDFRLVAWFLRSLDCFQINNFQKKNIFWLLDSMRGWITGIRQGLHEACSLVLLGWTILPF